MVKISEGNTTMEMPSAQPDIRDWKQGVIRQTKKDRGSLLQTLGHWINFEISLTCTYFQEVKTGFFTNYKDGEKRF